MREILFRGKMKDGGVWVYGAFCGANCETPVSRSIKQAHIIMYDEPYDGYWVEVEPATVGQYTGMTDKNGTKIFDGDIIHELDGSMDNIARVVRWDIDYMEYTCPLVGKHWCYGYNGCPLWMMHSENIEVIGNIHDHPELIGGTEDD